MSPALDPKTPMLIVDDSKAIRALLEAYLARLGFTDVRSSDTVDEALRAFAEQKSEIVFLDVILGREDGAEFAREALEARPFTTIVLTTALAADDEMVTALVSQGARHLLSKPIQLSGLKAVLAKIADNRAEEAGQLPPVPPPGTTPSTVGYQ